MKAPFTSVLLVFTLHRRWRRAQFYLEQIAVLRHRYCAGGGTRSPGVAALPLAKRSEPMRYVFGRSCGDHR